MNLNRLNARQRDAVEHASGPLLILAGAGSGKTSTMAHRIAHLIANRHVPGDAILGLSFTNKAATELKQRVVGLVTQAAGKRATRGLIITTFHSLCARLLRAHAELLGFQNNFTILDQTDQLGVLRQVLRNIRIDDRRFDPELILFEIGQAKNRLMDAAQAESFFLESKRLTPDYALAAASAFSHYQDQLKVLNSMDFDDLIYYAVRLLEKEESVRDLYNYKFRHILVDEYQDTNATQFKILKLLTEKQQNLCVVGDDDQSIYSWRGADPSHILGFKNHYPDAHVVALEQNYRSTSKILEAANSVIEKNRNRYPKKLWSDRGEGEALVEVVVAEDRAESEFVAEEILRRKTSQERLWGDFALLYRSNAQSRVFEEALRRRSIPYKIVGGLSFLARKEVKDVLSYWRLVANSKDDASLRRVLNWPARGIGKTSVEVLSSYAFENSVPLFQVLSHTSYLENKVQKKAFAAIASFRRLIEKLREQLENTPGDPASLAHWARNSLELIEAKRALEEESDDPVQVARKWENVEELVHSIGQYKVVRKEPAVETASASSGAPSTVASAASASIWTDPVTGLPFSAIGSSELAADLSTDIPFDMSSLLSKPVLPAVTAESVISTAPPTGLDALAEGGSPSEGEGSAVYVLRDFLNRMSLEAQEEEKDQDDPLEAAKHQVTLLTLHGAKGLEFPVVFMVGVEDGILPHQRTIDEMTDLGEERRLCYVGITRAKDHLYLVRAKNRMRYGKPVPRTPSRFLGEIPRDLVVTMDESGIVEPSGKAAQEEHEVRVKNYLADIRARLNKK